MAWKADNVRAIFFPAGPPGEVLDLWALLGLGAPDQFQKRVAGTGIGHASGGGVFLVVQPGRLEVRWQKVDPEEGPQLLDDPEQELGNLRDVATRLLDSVNVTRVACCADLVEQQASIEAANKRLIASVPGFTFPDKAQDVLVQLNVRKACSSAGVEMNRLCKWATAMQQLVQIDVAPTQSQPMLISERVVSTFSLDLNTLPQAIPYDAQTAKKLFDELTIEAVALMKNGYGALT